MATKEIIVSSGNEHKLEEIKRILKDLNVKVLSKRDVGLGDFDVIEDGSTLEENAMKKAVELSKKIKGIILADDTGLYVDALGGEPGVHSARYAGDDATYRDNNKKLLHALEGVALEDRTARFETVIVIVLESGETKVVKGQCEGKIGFEHKGDHGFGYDPLFIVEGYNKTFAELGHEIKNEISHRANALIKLREALQTLLEDDGH